ncbi:conserved Plasmodium protein, unknown function [Plasmodium chabaudi adami]|uniref:Uncharacterized protein n=1 Tax=Plasmodium chabaudi adami TaxID=5826 RepID=A0A1D3RTR3_PLACE|nr:conserved Plasmodium protein, unknown function [Plasmodium chabaudi adami]
MKSNNEQDGKDKDDWEYHPLFLSKIPSKKDIDKNSALLALITLINEEEENEEFNYEPRRKNLNKKITEKGEIMYKNHRRNLCQPYQQRNNNLSYMDKRHTNNNFGNNKKDDVVNNEEKNNENNSSELVNDDKDKSKMETTSIGEVLVCLSMLDLKK